MENEKYHVPGLARGIQILRLFNHNKKVIGAPEMAEALNIPRTTVFRLATTLADYGLLEKVEYSQSFKLGVGVLSLGFELLAGMDLTELGRPVLDRLAEATGLASHLVIRDQAEVIMIYKALGRSNFTGALNVGARLPAHATVLGRVLLMELSAAELAEIYPIEKLEQYTPQTPATRTELKQILEADKARGYAVSEAYFETGVSSIAAPVYGERGVVRGAINVTLPAQEIADTEKENLIKMILDAAAELSSALRYQLQNTA